MARRGNEIAARKWQQAGEKANTERKNQGLGLCSCLGKKEIALGWNGGCRKIHVGVAVKNFTIYFSFQIK